MQTQFDTLTNQFDLANANRLNTNFVVFTYTGYCGIDMIGTHNKKDPVTC